MKTQSDPRHKSRVTKFKQLFTYSFGHKTFEADSDVVLIIDNLKKIDNYIQVAAPEWPIERLNKIDLAILRLAVYELLIDQKTPPKVVIDEAVELGKSYGGESTAKFVNGVLGTLLEKRDKLFKKRVRSK